MFEVKLLKFGNKVTLKTASGKKAQINITKIYSKNVYINKIKIQS